MRRGEAGLKVVMMLMYASKFNRGFGDGHANRYLIVGRCKPLARSGTSPCRPSSSSCSKFMPVWMSRLILNHIGWV